VGGDVNHPVSLTVNVGRKKFVLQVDALIGVRLTMNVQQVRPAMRVLVKLHLKDFVNFNLVLGAHLQQMEVYPLINLIHYVTLLSFLIKIS
jgi:hypothetical protein